MNDKIASLIRALSIPPIMITVLIFILNFTNPDFFINSNEVIVLILFLGIFPVLAYPVQFLIPSLKKAGRDGQRKLAFIFTIIGYCAAFLWSEFFSFRFNIILVTNTYFISVIILTMLNKGFHFKASGHSCSFTAPIVFLTYFSGLKWGIISAIAAGLIWWSSIHLKRHTNLQLIGGVLTCLISFFLSLAFIP